MTITVSIASVGDAAELATAFVTLLPQLSASSKPPSPEAVAEILAHGATTQFVARDAVGRIVGVSTLAVFPIPTGRRAWIEDVIVDETSAGRGVGAKLCDAMVARARDLGCTTVDLTSRPSRQAANHLYQKLGFVTRDTNVWRYELGT